MLALRPAAIQRLWLIGRAPSARLTRRLHKARGDHKKRRATDSTPQNLSLLEELFPEEVPTIGGRGYENDEVHHNLPRLSLPDVEDVAGEFQDSDDRSKGQPIKVTKAVSRDAFRQQSLALLVLQTASKSLVESDFRRIAPKGHHIDWTGPGDILKGLYGAITSDSSPS